MTRIFYATDLHGSESCFRKFLNAGSFYKARVLILGGDITGKMIVPFVEHADGTFEAHYLGEDHIAKSKEELERMKNLCRDIGFYPYQTSLKEMEELKADKARVDELWLRLSVERVEKWVGLIEDHVKYKGVQIYMTGGNDDHPATTSILKRSRYRIDPEDEVIEIDRSHEMISCGFSNPTPWKTWRECSEDELAKKIEATASQVKKMENCVFNLHVPPSGSGIDEAPELTGRDEKDLKMKLGTISAGSHAVRQTIEKHQPLLGLFGHIHESRGAIRLGRTLCINPGSEYTEGILRGAVVNLENGRVKGYMLTSG